MDAAEVASRVDADLDAYFYLPLSREEAGTSGTPWSEQRERTELALLRQSLVSPVLIDVVDVDQSPSRRNLVKLWLVAVAPNNSLVLYDPISDEFALAVGDPSDRPETINVRGDLCSTFIAR